MNIAIIDDHRMIIDLLGKNLEASYPDASVMQFSSGDHFARFVSNDTGWMPDVIISDLAMPGMNGEDLLAFFRQYKDGVALADVKIIILSSLASETTFSFVTASVADAYLSKESSFEELKAVVDAVMLGGRHFRGADGPYILDSLYASGQKMLNLSPREKDLLQEVCKGRTIPEAADALNISVNTAKSYYKNIMKKFGVSRTAELVVIAIRRGMYIP